MDKIKVTGIGGLLAGVVGSVCCVGPAVLAGLGFGTAAVSFARDFGFLHIPLMVLAVVLLGTAFYLRSRKVGSQEESSAACSVEAGKWQSKNIFLWAATAITAALFAFPYLR